MTREEVIEWTGEDPEDVFGSDWETIIEDLEFDPDKPYNFMSDWVNGNL